MQVDQVEQEARVTEILRNWTTSSEMQMFSYHDICVESATPDHASPWLLVLELVVFEYSPV